MKIVLNHMSGGAGGEEPKPKLIVPSFLTPKAFREERRAEVRERRVRIRRVDSVEEGKSRVNPNLLRELGIEDVIEVTVGSGSSRVRRYVFTVIADDKVPVNEVWCNSNELKRYGVADNSMVTVRAHRRQR